MPMIFFLLQAADSAVAAPEPVRRSGTAFWTAIGAVFIIAMVSRRRRSRQADGNEGGAR